MKAINKGERWQPETGSRYTFPLFLCLPLRYSLSVCKVCLCVIIRLDTHISQGRWKCCFCSWHLSIQDYLKDIARGERLSPLCIRTLARHVIACLCVFVKDKTWICSFVCIYLSEDVCEDIWPNKHVDTLKTSEKGSMFRVKLSNIYCLVIC